MLRKSDYLQNVAYSNANKLEARIAFWRKYGGDPREQFGGGLVQGFSAPTKAKILEVGRGNGVLWTILGDDVRPDWSVTLTDLSQGMLNDAKSRLSEFGFVPEFIVADVQDLPTDGNSFDVVIANYMLYHLPDVAAGIAELARVLKPDGKLFAATNGKTHLLEIRELERRFRSDSDISPESDSIIAPFSIENGAGSLGRTFADVEVHEQKDILNVRSGDDLVLYMESMATPLDVAALKNHLDGVMMREGSISITRSSGYFVASHPISG